jgi:hypothetical protein
MNILSCPQPPSLQVHFIIMHLSLVSGTLSRRSSVAQCSKRSCKSSKNAVLRRLPAVGLPLRAEDPSPLPLLERGLEVCSGSMLSKDCNRWRLVFSMEPAPPAPLSSLRRRKAPLPRSVSVRGLCCLFVRRGGSKIRLLILV